jgi:hypothetical protein
MPRRGTHRRAGIAAPLLDGGPVARLGGWQRQQTAARVRQAARQQRYRQWPKKRRTDSRSIAAEQGELPLAGNAQELLALEALAVRQPTTASGSHCWQADANHR